jgi:hypothetical protein
MKALAVLLATAATIAVAAETAQWPPPSPVEARMKELQAILGSKESTPAQREAARKELSGLLKSPAGRARGATPDEKPARPARAAIEPLPGMVKPADGALPVAPPVARLDVVPAPPPRMLVIPGTGSVATPSGRFAIDPRTGAVLHEIPGGYVDPRTGQVTPR